jgi:hypothetical protein
MHLLMDRNTVRPRSCFSTSPSGFGDGARVTQGYKTLGSLFAAGNARMKTVLVNLEFTTTACAERVQCSSAESKGTLPCEMRKKRGDEAGKKPVEAAQQAAFRGEEFVRVVAVEHDFGF